MSTQVESSATSWAAETPLADFGGISLSPSVERSASELSPQGPLTALDLLSSLAKTHPDYAGGRFGSASTLPIDASRLKSYESISELFAALMSLLISASAQLHTRIAALGIAALEPTIGRELDRLGVLKALEEELSEPLEQLLSPVGRQLYRRALAGDGSPPHPDQPTDVDELDRRAFADLLATRLKYLRGTLGNRDSYMLLLHGNWGSGKSSVLRFLKQKLQSDPKTPWVVVEFNAWRYRHRHPPWWSLIREIYQQALPQLRDMRKADRLSSTRLSPAALRRRWVHWHFQTGWLPAGLSISSLLLLLVIMFYGFGLNASDNFQGSLQGWLTLLLLLAGTGWGWFLGIRRWLLGSTRAAELYDELRQDPVAPLKKLFERLSCAEDPSLAVFIDDLDRCDTAVVVELLEGIQTMFRDTSVTYIVAADQDWIRTAFAKAYETFQTAANEPGKPLGYLFLEKLFQEVVPLPEPELYVIERYWKRLLTRAVPIGEEVQQGNSNSGAEKGDSLVAERAKRLEAAKQFVMPEARQEALHALEPYWRFIEPNPRTMKRLANTLGMTQATAILQGRDLFEDSLVRWCVLEARWPLVAEALRHDPNRITEVGAPLEGDELTDAFKDPKLVALIKGDGVSGAEPWTAAHLQQLW